MLKILDGKGNIYKKLLEQKEYYKKYYYFMDFNNFFRVNEDLVLWNSPGTVVYNLNEDKFISTIISGQ